MPNGVFKHSSIAGSPKMSAECLVGWIAHYVIGISLATAFVLIVGVKWLQTPTLPPAFIFGIISVAAPFLIMQPCFGLGFAASKTPNPTQARLRSLMNHAAFGVGLYLSAFLTNYYGY